MSHRRMATSGGDRARRRDEGYSLVELIVGLTVAVIVLVALFQVFQSNTQLARTQTDLADMQQSLRVGQNEMVRLVRMAGRGGLASMIDNFGTRLLPAIAIRDNVGANENIAVGDNNSPTVTEGTDVLTIRGVFNSPVYQLNFADPTTFTLFDNGGAPTTDPTQAVSGQILVFDPSPTGIPQDLTALDDAISDRSRRPEALVVVSPIDESVYAVVELDARRSSVAGNQATVRFVVRGGTYTQQYRNLYASGNGPNPVLPSGLTNAAFVGLLEEHRFYVREPVANTAPAPSLSTARMYPGTEVSYGTAADLQLDIADNILNLQVSLGFDSSLGPVLSDQNGDGLVNEDDIVITESADGQDDDWLFNSDQDNPMQAPWMPPWDDDPLTATPPEPRLYYVRLSTLARVQVPERTFQSPSIQRIEDADVTAYNTTAERQFRRRLLQTTVDVRNL